MSDLLRRLDIPMPHYADEDGYFTVPAWVIELTAEAAARIRELEAQVAEARVEGWRQGVEAAAEVCTAIIRDYDVMKPDGKTYEPVQVQRAAKGLVSVAREDIRALPLPADLGVRHD